ncbi:MAG TPA: phosphomannomutase/phosphoglucomutase [Candidatus Saccharimonadales bacterium]|nr:phosphomannomutase/phosphoglucomutase [Candidatus Saccharimonadales bacterium]
MQIDHNIFKAYDIRGTYPDQINERVCSLIGWAFAEFLSDATGPIVVGRDMREDSGEMAKAFIQGAASRGREVVDLGLITTDMMYFATGYLDAAGGAMITASHNPGQYNGIKLSGAQAQPIGIETGLVEIQNMSMQLDVAVIEHVGTIIKRDLGEWWVDHVLSLVSAGQWPKFKVAIDAGNGMAGQIVPIFAKNVPLIITPLYFELDGTFPHHLANPAIDANLVDLIKAVKSGQLDFGLAFDGDGDRVYFVDETGQPLTASVLAAILAQDLLKKNPGAPVLYDLRMSKIMPEAISAAGGQAIRTPVGGAHIRPALKKHDGVMAAEGVGHFYFRDNYYSDSGLLAAALAIDILARSGKKLSELAQPFRKYFHSGELSFDVADPKATIEKIAIAHTGGKQDRLDGLTVDYGTWWFNLRASHTEPLVRLNVEANNQDTMEQKCQELEQLIKT